MGYGTAGCRYVVLITICMLRIGVTNWYLSYRPLEFLDSVKMENVNVNIYIVLSKKLICIAWIADNERYKSITVWIVNHYLSSSVT